MIKFWEQSDRGKISPDINKIYELLSNEGFVGEALDDRIDIYKVTGHFVEKVHPMYVLQYFRDMLVDEKSEFYTKTKNRDYEFFQNVWESFTKFRLARIFDANNFVNFPKININIKHHTRTSAYYYFKNCFVEVTAKGIVKHPYSKLNGYIYKKNIIDRDFDIVPKTDTETKKQVFKGAWAFADFLKKISQKAEYDTELKESVITFDQTKYNYLQQLIGFALHDYKQKGDTDFAPIFCDDEAGGSGKGILIQAISQLTNLCNVDARKVRLFDSISMTKETRVKVYNDVAKNHQFDLQFNEITEFGSIMYKNGHEEIIPYEKSWKVLFTSNFTIRGNTDADKRRQRIFDMFPFFGANKTPKDYYGGSMFFSAQWTDPDWNYFYTEMFTCVQQWLLCDFKVQYDNTAYNLRKMEESYPFEFRKFMDTINTGSHETSKLYDDFKANGGNSPFVKKINSNFFGRMVTNYLTEMKIPYHKNGNRTEIYIDKDAAPEASDKLPGSETKELPF